MFERFNYGVYGFIILEYILKPVSLTDHRNYSQEEHYLGNEGFLEHIRPSPEYGLILESLEDYQRIHQSIAMVGSNNHGSVLRNIFITVHFQASVGPSAAPIDIRAQCGI